MTRLRKTPRTRGFAALVGIAATAVWLAASPAAARSWVGIVGGPDLEAPAAIVPTDDGGHVVAGFTTSAGSGGLDGLVVRLDACGEIVWQFAVGGPGDDLFSAVALTGNGDLILAGETDSFGTSTDWWIVRLAADGALLWQRRFGGDGPDGALGVAAAGDGTIVAVGEVSTPDNGVDGGLVALNASGAVLWARRGGGTGPDALFGVTVAPSGDVTAVGQTSVPPSGALDGWVLRTDSQGSPVWQFTIGGAGDETLEAVIVDGSGIVAAGSTDSDDDGRTDHWALSLDALGAPVWQVRIGGSDHDSGRALALTDDGDPVLAGDLADAGAGTSDALISWLDGSGTPGLRRGYGGVGDQETSAIAATGDGVLIAGSDVAAGEDIWLVAADRAGGTGGSCGLDFDPTEATHAPTGFPATPATAPAPYAFAATDTTAVRVPAGLTLDLVCPVVPGEVSPPAAEALRFVGPTVATWATGARSCATSFNVYRGELETLPTGGNAICDQTGLEAAQATLGDVPPGGAGRYYLVTGVAGGGEGPAGRSSAGVPRVPQSACPP